MAAAGVRFALDSDSDGGDAFADDLSPSGAVLPAAEGVAQASSKGQTAGRREVERRKRVASDASQLALLARVASGDEAESPRESRDSMYALDDEGEGGGDDDDDDDDVVITTASGADDVLAKHLTPLPPAAPPPPPTASDMEQYADAVAQSLEARRATVRATVNRARLRIVALERQREKRNESLSKDSRWYSDVVLAYRTIVKTGFLSRWGTCADFTGTYMPQPFRESLRRVEARYGGTATATLRRVRQAIFVDFAIFAIWVYFVVFPLLGQYNEDKQAEYPYTPESLRRIPWLMMMQGHGIQGSWWTSMGYPPVLSKSGYKMGVAYAFALFMSTVLIASVVVPRSVRSLFTKRTIGAPGRTEEEGSSEPDGRDAIQRWPYATAIFGMWDFRIASVSSARILRAKLRNRLADLASIEMAREATGGHSENALLAHPALAHPDVILPDVRMGRRLKGKLKFYGAPIASRPRIVSIVLSILVAICAAFASRQVALDADFLDINIDNEPEVYLLSPFCMALTWSVAKAATMMAIRSGKWTNSEGGSAFDAADGWALLITRLCSLWGLVSVLWTDIRNTESTADSNAWFSKGLPGCNTRSAASSGQCPSGLGCCRGPCYHAQMDRSQEAKCVPWCHEGYQGAAFLRYMCAHYAMGTVLEVVWSIAVRSTGGDGVYGSVNAGGALPFSSGEVLAELCFRRTMTLCCAVTSPAAFLVSTVANCGAMWNHLWLAVNVNSEPTELQSETRSARLRAHLELTGLIAALLALGAATNTLRGFCGPFADTRITSVAYDYAGSSDSFALALRIVANPIVLWVTLIGALYTISALARRVRKGTKEEARLRAELYALKEIAESDERIGVKRDDESRVGLIDAFEAELARGGL